MAIRLALCAVAILLSLASTQGVEYNGPLSSDSIRFSHFEHDNHRLAKRQAPITTDRPPVVDDHNYYTSQFFPPGPEADRLWVDLSRVNVLTHNISDEFRFFADHDLKFNFSFYGHIIDSVAITTAGFIYVGTYFHRFIHLTQYIAPLQADFNPGLNESATVLVYSTENQFTIQWDQVYNDDHVSDGPFTFQLTLFRDGSINFAYRQIPLLLSQINSNEHPVEVGLADSYYVDRPIPGGFILRTIFEYHRVDLTPMHSNLSYSAFSITPLPNCIMASSCEECVSVSLTSMFECEWCDNLRRCSDGFDRHRQEWFTSGCSVLSTASCSSTGTPTESTTSTNIVQPGFFQSNTLPLSAGSIAGISIAGIVIFVLAVMIFSVCIGVLIYGYRNPQSKIGLYMIEHRPKARSLNKGSSDIGVVYVADNS